MKKYKTGQNKPILDGLFTHMFPTHENGGETKRKIRKMSSEGKNDQKLHKSHMDQNQESSQPKIDEIWQWLGNPDAY